MCGIAGFLRASGVRDAVDPADVLKKMAGALVHRGPDSSGYWWNADNGIGFSHRRLAIVDLTPAGHQPMVSQSGRYVITFNGEIYNHLDLRAAIAEDRRHVSAQNGLNTPLSWSGHSDTETLLAGFDAWGIADTVSRSNGMFAMAIWDLAEKTLTLARDRLGEKPLYYGWHGDNFLFGSELKALQAHPSFHAKVDRGALCLMLRHGYVPAPYSIFEGIAKLEPGSMLTVSPSMRSSQVVAYWSLKDTIDAAQSNGFLGSPQQAVDELEGLLTDAVSKQMMSDVPLGAFLSGGIDSSTIVALAQSRSKNKVKTFTIGFQEEAYNEAIYAKAVADHLGTNHTELYVTPKQAMEVIPRLPTLYDEPFADSSQIPTFLVSQLAREHVTVSLSGDAGDELFCGYNRYQFTSKLWSGISATPHAIRSILAWGLTSLSPEQWSHIDARFGKILPSQVRVANLGDKLHKAASLLGNDSSDELYRSLVSYWRAPASIVIGGHEPPTYLTGLAPNLSGLDTVERMMALDALTYLPDDILVKVDRAAMGVSLESRVPFLDHRVVEFAWRLPMSMKLRDGMTKWVLRELLDRHVPKALIERPKMGFGVPLDTWLRGPMRQWAEDLLAPERLAREGFFHPELIRQRWAEHLSGSRNWQSLLWNVLMFQGWLENQQGNVG